MTSSISSFEIINVPVPEQYVIGLWDPEPRIVLPVPASALDAAPNYPNGMSTLSANGVSKCFINGQPTFINGPRSLPRNSPDCTYVEIHVFLIIFY